MSKDKSIGSAAFLRKLCREVDKLGGTSAAARKWGVKFPHHLSSAMNGNRLPTTEMLIGMGYEHVKEINYRYKPVEDK